MTKAIPKECRNGHARIPENRSPEDKCLVDEVVRSTKILGLMDKLETALTSRERQHIQQQIRDLA